MSILRLFLALLRDFLRQANEELKTYIEAL
jgi:hypothetical protein